MSFPKIDINDYFITSLFVFAAFTLSLFALPSVSMGEVVINEVDADQASTDIAEFIELYDGGIGNTDLTGLVLVLFNGSDDASYLAFDLDGLSTDGNGYFVLCGNAANIANCDMDVLPDTNLIQNGADAVALIEGDAVDFPNDTPVTTTGLVDAVVYDTDDADDAGLLVLLNAGQPQVNERDGGDGTGHSNQRCFNGYGGARNTDTYAQYVPTPGAENSCPQSFGNCGDPSTKIHTIQGDGDISQLNGSVGVIVEGVVVGDFQNALTELRGFFVQEEDDEVDPNPNTSEGIFVYDNNFGVDVNVGDVVRVKGTVVENYGSTELKTITDVVICSSIATTTAAIVNLPVESPSAWEKYEGMLVHIPQTLYAIDNYKLGRYGEVGLSVSGRLDVPTNVTDPGILANELRALNDRSRILLDDGSYVQNPAPLPPYIGFQNTLRAGDTLDSLTGVLNYTYGAYKVHPTEAVNFNRVNEREEKPPSVNGSLKVASFNVLNYFSTLDDSEPICGPSSDMACRGADTPTEFARQRDKIITTIDALDADVIGLMEVENHPTDAALIDLVSGLNDAAGSGTYSYIPTGPIGTDAIKVAFIYKTTTVIPVGDFAILDSSVDPTFNDMKNRPSLAQTFGQISTDENLTVVVNHLKSKGSDCNDLNDPDEGDGQGNCNLTRTAAIVAVANWLATDPTGNSDLEFLIIGDLNSYAMEDPIVALENAGYINLIKELIGDGAYSYVIYGEKGYLDHALASERLALKVSGVSEWHINADEPASLDYNDYNQSALYSLDQYRSSDHDPVIVGMDLVPTNTNDKITPNGSSESGCFITTIAP